MNLIKLFETQRILDARIMEEHPLVEGEERLAKKTLALQVELGELANELPEVFKFWSNKKNNYEKALKEYVDCLHFILSIGLELKNIEHLVFVSAKAKDITYQFIEVFDTINTFLYDPQYYDDVINSFIDLGEMLGFTADQVEQAYYDKNAINHERQDTGY